MYAQWVHPKYSKLGTMSHPRDIWSMISHPLEYDESSLHGYDRVDFYARESANYGNDYVSIVQDELFN